jgi:hypothetical protein
MLRYKFLYEKNGKIKSQHGSELWEIGKWQKTAKTPELCHSGYHCSKGIGQAFGYIQGEILAKVEVRGDSDISADKECYQEMRIVKAYKWTKKDSLALAIFSAELVLKIFEDKYPNDKRPREAIEAAKKVLEKDTKKNRAYAANAATYAATAAANAADYAAANAATYAATYAANAATYAATAAANAATTAAAAAATYAATAATYAASKQLAAKIEKWLKTHVKELEEL